MQRDNGKAIIIFLFGILLMALIRTEGLAFRCGDGLVSIGDSKAKVMLECGKPGIKDRVAVKESDRYEETKTSADKGRTYKKGKSKKKTQTVEKWYYNCGENDLLYVLTFEGGVLAKEDTEGRGKGKSQCTGRR